VLNAVAFHIVIIEKKKKQQLKSKTRPANTYASCGRDDPARKRRLNRISFADFQFPLAGSLI
jgi:hypothetical protein